MQNQEIIPTAEDLFKEVREKLSLSDNQNAIYCMKEFAKLHVEAALKEASEKAQWICESQESWFGDTRDYDFCETDNDGDKTQIHSILINKESILNAYPLTNIK